MKQIDFRLPVKRGAIPLDWYTRFQRWRLLPENQQVYGIGLTNPFPRPFDGRASSRHRYLEALRLLRF